MIELGMIDETFLIHGLFLYIRDIFHDDICCGKYRFFRIEVVIMRLKTTYKSYKYWSIIVCVFLSCFVGTGYFSWFLMDMFVSFRFVCPYQVI